MQKLIKDTEIKLKLLPGYFFLVKVKPILNKGPSCPEVSYCINAYVKASEPGEK